MFDFYQKRKIKVLLASRYTQAVLIILIILMAWSAYGRFQIAKEMEQRRAEVEQEANVLEERKKELQAEVEYLSNERGIEAEMRRQFDIAKDGEKVVVIVEDEEELVQPLERREETTSTTDKEWYEFWR